MILSKLIFLISLSTIWKTIQTYISFVVGWIYNEDVEIGDDMIILQDMDSDDDTNKNGRELTAGQLTTKKNIGDN